MQYRIKLDQDNLIKKVNKFILHYVIIGFYLGALLIQLLIFKQKNI